MFERSNDEIIKENNLNDLKLSIKNFKQELQLKNEEITAYEELFKNKADDEYKYSKISEQSEYILELEKNLNFYITKIII